MTSYNKNLKMMERFIIEKTSQTILLHYLSSNKDFFAMVLVRKMSFKSLKDEVSHLGTIMMPS